MKERDKMSFKNRSCRGENKKFKELQLYATKILKRKVINKGKKKQKPLSEPNI